MLECLSLTGLSNIVLLMLARPGAELRVEHLKGASLGWAMDLLANVRLSWKGLAGNTFSLLGKIVNNGQKRFIT
jgi:hypothetical protein